MNPLTKKVAAALAPVGLVLALPLATLGKTITVDGVFTDWDDVTTSFSGTPFTGSSAEFSANGTTYYYNTATDAWQTTDPGGDTCKANYDYMVAVDSLKVTNDNNYLYLLWERGTDFTDFRWDGASGGNYYIFSDQAVPATAPNHEFTDTPPCAGHVLKTPANFDHDLVISVDTNKDGSYEYYLVINITFPQDTWANGSMYEARGLVLQDNGNGAYDGISGETLKTTFGNDGFEIGISTASNIGVKQEWKMSINDIFTDLGISWGSSANIRYEGHSLNPSSTTEVKAYTFAKGKKVKLSASVKKKTKKSQITLKGNTAKGATVKIFVNGTDLGTIKVSGKGKFSKKLSLQNGSNTVRIFASHAKKGTKNITKAITRK